MKKEILMTALAVSMLIACKKSDADTPAPGGQTTSCVPVPDIATNEDGDTSNAFFYNANTSNIGKIQDYDGDGGRNGYTLYSYSSGKITESDYYDNGNVNGDGSEYHLDNAGRVKMETYYEIFTASHDTIFFQYDANGNNTYRIHKSVGVNTTRDTTVYLYIGNTRVSSDKIKNGVSVQHHEYTYTANEDKVAYNTLLNDLPGRGLFGKISTNLIAKDVFTDETGSSTDYTATYTYEFDSNGYPVKVTYDVAAASGGISFSDVTKYKYMCR